MRILPSGLPEEVADSEDLARFLAQRGQFNSVGAKPAAFLPNPKYRNTSVFRQGADPEQLRQTWTENDKSGRTLKAAAVCKAQSVRECHLDVIADDQPARHANIEGWPWIDSNPELEKSQQLRLALRIAEASELVLL